MDNQYREPSPESHRDTRDRSYSPARGSSPEKNGADNNGSNLFVTGLAPTVTEDDLEGLFSKYGSVEKSQIMKDPHSGDSRGFGFINFSSAHEAEAALALDGTEFQGKNIIVQKAKRSRARTPTPGQYRGPIKQRRDRYNDRYDPRGYNEYSRPYGREYDRPRYDRGGYDRPYDRGYDRERYGRDRFEQRERYDHRERYDQRERYDPRERYPPREMERPYENRGYDSGRERPYQGRY